MASVKHKRLESQLQKAVSEIIAQDLKNKKDIEFVSVTGVALTTDLSYLKIFVHFMNIKEDNQPKALEVLAKKAGAIKMVLGKKVSMRKMPELIFKIDGSFAEAHKIDQLLRQTKSRDLDE